MLSAKAGFRALSSYLLAATKSVFARDPFFFGCSSRRYFGGESYQDVQTSYFDLSSGDRIAYKRTTGSKLPGVIFLPGYQANMTGQKALILERYCSRYDHPFIRFDFRGVGESCAPGVRLTMMDWIDDALTVLDTLTHPNVPQILVGSSMGGFLALNVAVKRPERVFGVVGVATPFDEFLQHFASMNLSPEGQKRLDSGETIRLPWGNVNKKFIDTTTALYEGLYRKKDIPIKCPVRLLHGMEDTVIRFSAAYKIASLVQSDDVQVVLSKSADHRFSRQQDLQTLVNTIDQLMKIYEYPEN